MTDLDTPVVLVTGASRGIGLEVARQLSDSGHRVLASARDQIRADEAAGSLPSPGRGVALDVTDDASVAAAVRDVSRHEGRIDVLVNNAAAYVDWAELPSAADLDDARRALETNLFGAWRVTAAFLPLIRDAAHPRIVNVSSGAGSHGDPDFGLTTNGGAATSYGVSKAALCALTSRFAAELGGTGVLVNAVCPGLTATWPGAEDMGARPIAEGARSVTWAATLPDDGPTGGFFRDGRPLPW
jgi:NAD(P)-dependent dehydrogenase (short-subunit alcohol dehydrogenase family)